MCDKIGMKKIAYLYNRQAADASSLGADVVYADTKTTRRMERAAMIDGGGLREGDTLYLRAMSDLGQGAEVKAMRLRIEAMGVDIVEIPMDKPPKAKPKVWLQPSDDQKDRLCTLWYSSLEQGHILTRAEDIMGRTVTRNQMNRLCGPRHKKQKK